VFRWGGGGQVSILGSGTTHSPNTYRCRRGRQSHLRPLGAERLVLRNDAQQTVKLEAGNVHCGLVGHSNIMH